MGLFDNFLKGVRDFSTTVRETREAIEASKREREDLATAMPARSDIKALMGRWIDACGDSYSANLQRHVLAMMPKASKCTELGSTISQNLLRVLSVPPHGGGQPDARSIDIALMAVFGKEFKAFVFRAIDTMEWPGPEGLPWEERRVAIETLDKRIAGMETKYAEMAAVARQHGVIVE